MGITVVGLGSGDERQLTLGVWQELQAGKPLFLRTAAHPVCSFLRSHGIEWRSFDDVYERHEGFAEVYEEIAAELMDAAAERDIVYAVPGHPSVAEQTVRILSRACPPREIRLSLMGGESFLDQAFVKFGLDPIDGFQCVDGTNFTQAHWNPYMHTLVAQVYDRLVASDLKLSLMSLYPSDYSVYVGHHLGVAGEEQILKIPLFELDHLDGYGNLSVVWIPKAEDEALHNRTFARLKEIVEILRSPGGCPWDREQTHQSIRKNLIEETCEVLDTIDADEPVEMCEELGDLLLQIMLHAQMEDEVGEFSAYDVIQAISDKLIRRHPHVFGSAQVDTTEQVMQNWQQIKREEKRQQGIDVDNQSILGGLPRELSSLLRAFKMQKKAASVGFDWPSTEQVWQKCEEELAELDEAVRGGVADQVEDEFGDVLFSLVNLARFLKLDPELALARTNRKFERRFVFVEQQLRSAGLEWSDTTLAQLDAWWNEAKEKEFL